MRTRMVLVGFLAMAATGVVTPTSAAAEPKKCDMHQETMDCYVWDPDFGWMDYCGETICVYGEAPGECPSGWLPTPLGGCTPYPNGSSVPDGQLPGNPGSGGPGGGFTDYNGQWSNLDFELCDEYYKDPCECCEKTSDLHTTRDNNYIKNCKTHFYKQAEKNCKAGNGPTKNTGPVEHDISAEEVCVNLPAETKLCKTLLKTGKWIDYGPCIDAWIYGVGSAQTTLSAGAKISILKGFFGVEVGAETVEKWPAVDGWWSACSQAHSEVVVMRGAEYAECMSENDCNSGLVLQPGGIAGAGPEVLE